MTAAPASPAASQEAAVDAALLVLKSMGLSLEDLSAAPGQRPTVPTFAEYVPVVSAHVTNGTRRAYGSYWNRVVDRWGARRLDEPTPSEVKQFAKDVKENAVSRRLPSTRRAIADTRLAEINQVAATTGDDPELDALILRLHTETAGRRGGALALRPLDLDPEQCLVCLREKGETVRWQPVSPP
jgi:integrase/recombinase XerC